MVPGEAVLVFLVVVFSLGTSYGDNEKVEIVGVVECSDCGNNNNNNNIKVRQVFSGLYVTIDCKHEDGRYKTKGAANLDQEGKFRVYDLPAETGQTKQSCYANLHSSFNAECASTHNGQESYKIIFLSKTNEKLTLGLKENLKFSITTCTSAFLWPYFNYPPLPPFPGFDDPLPLIAPSPNSDPESGAPSSVPTYKKPLPPHAPISSGNAHSSTPKKSKPDIPKAPPIPSLPPIPSVPRKYSNKPKVGPQPPAMAPN